ncbi:hypothetical protein RUM44_003938 [Polyplax serrata]|uniref:Large ribosomal subunit protein mL62 n=1 Tax=Polyplax serrata TaxID=468196 RepID=A0ABR1B1F2_POLSC
MITSRGISLLKVQNLFKSGNAFYLSYKSDLSLDKLYPSSTEIKTFKPPQSTDGKFTGYIPIKELNIKSTAASGPGGQFVNKTETKVDVRFQVDKAGWLSKATKDKLKEKYYTRINKDGYFVVKSEKTRSKLLNTADAVNYIRQIIFKLEEPERTPDAATLEKHRRCQERAARQRLMEKRSRSLHKQSKILTHD